MRAAFGDLAFGSVGNAAREIGDELAVIEVARGAGNGGFAGHGINSI
jgi:hypothetical protein